MRASIVKQFNHTLKTRTYRDLSEQGEYRWLKVIPELVKEYNDNVYSTIDMKKWQVNERNERRVLEQIGKKYKRRVAKKQKFNIGDHVRINKYKITIANGY